MTTSRPTQISFLVLAYNEDGRIKSVIEQALAWADEIVVIDKSSTDKTSEICESYGSKIKHLVFPYSTQGQDDFNAIVAATSCEWIYHSTASEMPTKRLVQSCRYLLQERGQDLDLIFVPRKRYMYGVHTPYGKLADVTEYPFLFHRTRAKVQDRIHANFSASDKSRVGRIEYSDDCCVHHLSYPTVAGFMHSHSQYMMVEAQQTPDKEVEYLIQRMLREGAELLEEICVLQDAKPSVGEAWLGHYCTLLIQRFGLCLHFWEKRRSADVKKYYQELTAALLNNEWTSRPGVPLPQLQVASNDLPTVTQRTSMNRFVRAVLPVKLRNTIRKRLQSLVTWFK
jgi:glycosyltransferase involved in cell wall biosynthesis